MSLDFCLLCVLFSALLGDDMARRGMKNPAIFWLTALIPLFGPLAYLCLRSPLPEVSSQASASQKSVLNQMSES